MRNKIMRKKIKLDNNVIACGLGAGVGVLISPLIEKYYSGIIPINEVPSPWNLNSVFYPIVLGSGSALIGLLLTKNEKSKMMFTTMGIASLISGLAKGILASISTSRARTQRSFSPSIRRSFGLNRRPVRPMRAIPNTLSGRVIRGRSSPSGGALRPAKPMVGIAPGSLRPKENNLGHISQTYISGKTIIA